MEIRKLTRNEQAGDQWPNQAIDACIGHSSDSAAAHLPATCRCGRSQWRKFSYLIVLVLAVNLFPREVQRDAVDSDSGALQRCSEDDAALGALADYWSAEKAWNHDLRYRIERPGCMPPTDVAAILPAQYAVEHDLVQTTAEVLDLAQQIFDELAK
jgi:hypothetical protein